MYLFTFPTLQMCNVELSSFFTEHFYSVKGVGFNDTCLTNLSVNPCTTVGAGCMNDTGRCQCDQRLPYFNGTYCVKGIYFQQLLHIIILHDKK